MRAASYGGYVLAATASEIPRLSAKVDWLVSDVPEATLARRAVAACASDPRARHAA